VPPALVLLAASLSFGDKRAAEAANAKSLALVGKTAPDFSLWDFDGRVFTLASQRGHFVVLAFWATWCPPCRAELATLAELQNELAPQGVTVITVAYDDRQKARDYLRNKHVDIRSLWDEGGRVSGSYGAHVLPKTFLINPDGSVIKVIIGKLAAREVRRAIPAAQ